MDILKYDMEIASYVTVCIGVVIALLSAIIAYKSYKDDHKRRKKQATFEFYHSIYKKFIKPLNKIDKFFPNGQTINVCELEKGEVKEKDAMLNSISEYLSCMERFSVGIYEDVYDINVFDRTVGSSLTIWWVNRFREFIPYFRKKYNSFNAYVVLEDFVYELERMKRRKT
jgi:hypothetical protein